MRLLIISSLALAVAACTGASEEGSDEGEGSDTSEAGAEDSAELVAFAPGEYTLIEDDQSGDEREVMDLSINDDDTFEVKIGDRVLAKGTYNTSDIEGGRKACFLEPEEDPEDEGNCFTVGERKDDGTWTATNDSDETATLTYIEE